MYKMSRNMNPVMSGYSYTNAKLRENALLDLCSTRISSVLVGVDIEIDKDVLSN